MIKRFMCIMIAICCLGCDPQPSSSPNACPTRAEIKQVFEPIFTEYDKAITLLMNKPSDCSCKDNPKETKK